MARNIRWYIPFVSQKGKSCRINIYDNNWPSIVDPARLTGTADPFYYQEDNRDDLLNEVVRYRTGYIKILRQSTDIDVDSIFPTSAFERYVEVLYGSMVVFNGYIQVQDFSQSVEPMPKVIEFPVISPLGLFDKRCFSYSFLPPRRITLGNALDATFITTDYQRVYVPQVTGTSLSQNINSLVISPWNDDYHHSMVTAAPYKVMKPEKRIYIIDAICKAFGWICHDTPTALIFTSYDYRGHYCYYPVGHIGDDDYKVVDSDTPVTAETLTDFFTPADDNATTTVLQPETGIEIDYEGEFGDRDFSFERTTFDSVIKPDASETYEKLCLCNLSPVQIVNEIQSVSPMSFVPDSSLINVGKGCVAWDGKEGILLSMSTGWVDTAYLFTLRYYFTRKNALTWNVSYDIMAGGTLDSLGSDSINSRYIYTNVTTYDNYVEAVFRYHFNSGDSLPPLADNYLVFIHNIKFEPVENNEPYAHYKFKPAEDSDTIPARDETNVPVISSSLTMPISRYRMNDHMIGEALLTTWITDYPYLFQPRTKMEHIFRLAVADMPVLAHTRLFAFQGKRWRIIAATFHPWNDEYQLTMQSSPVLDDNN